MELMRRQKEAVEVGEREGGDGIVRHIIEESKEGAKERVPRPSRKKVLSNVQLRIKPREVWTGCKCYRVALCIDRPCFMKYHALNSTE
jgi:hypothetical protein